MVEKDLYRLLGVSPSASEERIRSAYRKLVRRYHPDVYPGDPEVSNANIRVLTEAYETLTDPHRRREYDRERSQELEGPQPRGTWERSGPPRAVTIPRKPQVGWLHYPPPEPPWKRPPPSQDPATQRIVKAWKAAQRQSLRETEVPPRLKFVILLLFVSFLSIMAGLLTIPVSQAFSFADRPPCYGYGPSSATSYQFQSGDHVSFSWVTDAYSYSPSWGPPPGVALTSAQVGTIFASSNWNGSYSFVADGSSYSFGVASCSLEAASVEFQGNFVGPLL